MKGPFLTLAVVLGATAGFPVLAPMAAEIILAQKFGAAANSSETRFRKLVVEPKGTEVKDPVAAPAPVETTTVQPKIVVQPEGADAPAPATPPVVAQPEGATEPAKEVVKADPTPETPPTAPGDAPDVLGDIPKATPPAPAPTATAEDSVAGAAKLFDLLEAKGYDIEVRKGETYGQYEFYVTQKGNAYTDVLVVDGEYGKVIQRYQTTTEETYDDGYQDDGYAEDGHEPEAYEQEGYGDDSYGNSGSDGY